MASRFYRVIATRQWCADLHKIDGAFRNPPGDFMDNLAVANGLALGAIEVVEVADGADPRTGTLLKPPDPPKPVDPPDIAAAKAVLAKPAATPDELLSVLKVMGKRLGLV